MMHDPLTFTNAADAWRTWPRMWWYSQYDAFAAMPMMVQGLFVAVFGAVIGSFLTVVIHRLPIMMERAWQHAETESTDSSELSKPRDSNEAEIPAYNLAWPRSACPHCHHVLGPTENIPLFSYLIARGRCRACGAKIDVRYFAVELLTVLVAVGIWWRFGATPAAGAALVLAAALIALGFIDARTYLLPDSITLPLLWCGILLNTGGIFAPLEAAVWGAAAGYAFLWSIYWLFRLVRGREGMGYGDFKLFAALGAWFGWQALPGMIIVAAVSGAAAGVVAMAAGRFRRDEPLPFGPFLALAGIVAIFAGGPLTMGFGPSGW